MSSSLGAMDSQKQMITCRKTSVLARKIALQQDVDKLKKRLRHEENVHRALERAFTRPLGALPRLPPYLPPDTLELLAEVAVLEEEVVRLEEKVVHFRQGLYEEAVQISSSKKTIDTWSDFAEVDQIKDLRPRQSLETEANSAVSVAKNSASFSEEKRGKENLLRSNSLKIKPIFQYPKLQTPETRKRPSIDGGSTEKRVDPRMLPNLEIGSDSTKAKNHINRAELSTTDNCPNKISENILNCLINIFLRMSSKKSRGTTGTFPSLSVLNSVHNLENVENKDPYCICSEFEKRDIGPYKHLFAIQSSSVSPNRTTISVFLVQRLKLLLKKLAAVELKGISHQGKLAFWINIYNSCMMNAFMEYGVPESPEMVVALMQKATVNVGGHILNAITIQHFILRVPYHMKYTFSKCAKHDDMTTRSKFGLELSEPLVTFALSCGSWSSPAVRVYTASDVENELETAKRDYLQAAIGISTAKKALVIPKLLDWYLLDFAKNIESLLYWVCLQLPSNIGKEAMKCISSREGEPYQIIPYDFSFRYILHTRLR